MGYKEKEKINEVLIEGSKKGRLYRVNAGMAWIGKIIKKVKGLITLKNPRPFHGVPAGVHDIIGYERMTLCVYVKDYIPSRYCDEGCENCPFNKTIAIFKSVEVKPEGEDLTDKQEKFRRQVLKDGGISEVVCYEK